MMAAQKLRIGVLAMQGAVEPHLKTLQTLCQKWGEASRFEGGEVKTAWDLARVDGLILPGGESTAIIQLLKKGHLWDPLKNYASTKPVFGVCAGAILLAKDVCSPSQESLGVLPIQVERNAYGRQIDSFKDVISPLLAFSREDDEDTVGYEGVFIRAPKIVSIESGVEPLFEHPATGEVVMVEYQHILAATFHPELTQDTRIHQYFLKKVEKSVLH